MGTNDITVKNVWFDHERIFVKLNDERIVGCPLTWFPRLLNATQEQRENYEFTAHGYGIHWPSINEDLSAEGFLTFSKKVA